MAEKSFRELILESAKRLEISLSEDDKAVQEAEAIASEDYFEGQKRAAELAALNEKNENSRQNRELRKKYARSVMIYLFFYSLFVAAMLVMSGYSVYGFSLPDSVLEFLVGSTAASAIGLVLAVTHGLFKNLD